MMNSIDPQAVARRLQSFVRGFQEEDPADQTNIDLKLDHSLRVWEAARTIGTEESLDPDRTWLAEIAAVCHDVGRFPQYRRYRTFKDNVSVNHGRLGFQTLRTSDILHGFDRRTARLVLRAVFLHNRPKLPSGLPEPLRSVLWVVRDADKLDIVRVLCSHLLSNQTPSGVLTLGLEDDPARYSQPILDTVRAHGFVDYRDMVWVNDFKLLLCSWVFVLNFVSTRRLLRQQGLIQQLLHSLPQTGEVAELQERVLSGLETE